LALCAALGSIRPVLSAPQAPPVVNQVDPTSGANDLDTTIHLSGSDFVATPQVYLGDAPLDDVQWLSSSELTAHVPWGLDPGVYTLAVTNPGGETGSLPNAFTVTQGFGVWNTGQLYGGRVSQVEVHPNNPQMVYALVPEVGLFRSDDGGDHWSLKTRVPIYADLAIDPLPPYYLYMGDSMRSDDAGDTWTRLENLPENAGPIFHVHPLVPGTLYTSDWWPGLCGVWKSSDYGQTWMEITASDGLTNTCVTKIVFHPTNPDVAVAVAEWPLFYTDDGGDTWHDMGQRANRVAFNPSGAHELWVSGTEDGTFTSVYPFDIWNQIPGFMGTTRLSSIEFAPPGWGEPYSDTVFVSDLEGHFYRSSDGGENWQPFGPEMPGSGSFDPWEAVVWDIAVQPTNPNIIYLSGSGNGVYRTLDGGGSWAAANEGLAAMPPRQLEVLPGQADIVYAIFTGWPGIFRGSQGGQEWEYLPVPDADASLFANMLVDPFIPTRLYRSGEGHVLRSDDAGQSWPVTGTLNYPSQCVTPGYLYPAEMLADPAHPGVLLAGVNGWCHNPEWFAFAAIHRSVDGGLTWEEKMMTTHLLSECSQPYIEDLVFDAQDPEIVYASFDCGGVWRSEDSGQSWQRLAVGVPYEEDFILAGKMAVEPNPPYRVFLNASCTDNNCIYLSEDKGETWRQADDPLPTAGPEQLLFAPGNPPVLYAGLASHAGWYEQGLYRSANGSASWSQATGELGHVPIYSLAAATTADRVVLYAGTPGGVIQSEGGLAPQAPQQDEQQVAAGVYRYTTLDPLDLLPWERVNENGFGSPENDFVGSLAEFKGLLYAGAANYTSGAQLWRSESGAHWQPLAAPWSNSNSEAVDMQSFGGYLYAGTYNPKDGLEIWRSDGSAWEQVADGGFGSVENTVAYAFAEFSDMLYVATGHETQGMQIWRSPTGEAGSWQPVVTDGFGGSGLWYGSVLGVFDGHLYAGTGRDYLAELWRTADGSTWTPVFTNGLGDSDNTLVASMAEFKGDLYIGLRNVARGGQVWRSSNGLNWERAAADGLGNPDNGRPYGLITAGNHLYLVFNNLFSGAEVWRSSDGNSWRRTNYGGWGDVSNSIATINSNEVALFKYDLYIGTAHWNGGEVWRLPLASHIFLPILRR
jgi:hypothetical protein